jgi:hypothetical protein
MFAQKLMLNLCDKMYRKACENATGAITSLRSTIIVQAMELQNGWDYEAVLKSSVRLSLNRPPSPVFFSIA